MVPEDGRGLDRARNRPSIVECRLARGRTSRIIVGSHRKWFGDQKWGSGANHVLSRGLLTSMIIGVAIRARGPDPLADTRPAPIAYLAGELPRLSKLAATLLADARDVEDAVQDTLEAAWRKWDTLRDEAGRRAWLNTICVRRCLRVRRWYARHGTTALLDDVAGPDFAHDVDWDRALARLSTAQRITVVLHYQHGFTLDECAALMGRHPGTIRKHLSRGLARLRNELSDV